MGNIKGEEMVDAIVMDIRETEYQERKARKEGRSGEGRAEVNHQRIVGLRLALGRVLQILHGEYIESGTAGEISATIAARNYLDGRA